MILASDLVPGQLMPVGAKYWYNAGRPLNALKTVAGLSGLSGDLRGPLTDEEAAAMIMAESRGETPSTAITSPASAAAATASVGAGLVLAAILVRGGLGYVAGRAMAPTEAQKGSYGLWGIVAGGMFGLTGLAIQGAVALAKK